MSANDGGELPRAGEFIDRYRIVSRLGFGGMAAVYAASRESIGGFEKLLALKVMLPNLASDAEFVNMFLDEARIASRVRHPNVVDVIDVGKDGATPFLVMELLIGRSLAQLVESGPISPGVALAILAQAARGLHAAHETRGRDGEALGIVHRDVSPQNIFVTSTGVVKVLDFGVAAARGRLVATRTGDVKGKLEYLAPEQISREHEITRAVDIWALGVVAWELLAQRRLFKASTSEVQAIKAVLEQDVPDLAPLVPSVGTPVVSLIMRCLTRNPEARPATMLELASSFEEAARTLGADQHAITALVVERAGPQIETEHTALEVAAARDSGPQLFGDTIPATPVLKTGLTSVSPAPVREPSASKWLVAALVACAIGAVYLLTSRRPPPTTVSSSSTPSTSPTPITVVPNAVQAARSSDMATAPAGPLVNSASASMSTSTSPPTPPHGARVRERPRAPAPDASIESPLLKAPF